MKKNINEAARIQKMVEFVGSTELVTIVAIQTADQSNSIYYGYILKQITAYLERLVDHSIRTACKNKGCNAYEWIVGDLAVRPELKCLDNSIISLITELLHEGSSSIVYRDHDIFSYNYLISSITNELVSGLFSNSN